MGGMDHDGMGSISGGNSITNNNGAETFFIGDGGTKDEYSDEETRREDGKDQDGYNEDQGDGGLQGGGMDGGVDSQGAFGQGGVEFQGGAELQGNMEMLGGFIDGGVELQDVLVQGGCRTAARTIQMQKATSTRRSIYRLGCARSCAAAHALSSPGDHSCFCPAGVFVEFATCFATRMGIARTTEKLFGLACACRDSATSGMVV